MASLKGFGVILFGFLFLSFVSGNPLSRNQLVGNSEIQDEVYSSAGSSCECKVQQDAVQEVSKIRRRARQLSDYDHLRNHRCIKLLGSEHIAKATNGEPLTADAVASRLESMVSNLSQGLATLTGSVLPSVGRAVLPVTPIGLSGAIPAPDAEVAAEPAAEDDSKANVAEVAEPATNEVPADAGKAPP